MTPEQKVPALFALLKAARDMLASNAENLHNDVAAFNRSHEIGTRAEQVNFAVGALLPLEQLAADLQAILAAARALQGVRS